MRLGADVAGLDLASRNWQNCSRQLSAMVVEMDRLIATLSWSGRDADRFRADWSGGLRPMFAATAEQLSNGARVLGDQAGQQQRTSEPTTASWAMELPTRFEIYAVEAHGGGEAVGSGRLQFRVDHLDDGRVRVTDTGRVTLGVGASPGVGLAVGLGEDQVATGAIGSSQFAALVATGDTWELPAGDLDRFLMARARSQLLGDTADLVLSGLGSVPALGALAAGVGLGDQWRAMTYPVAEPVSSAVEVGALAELGGVAGVPAGGVTAKASASVVDVVGVTRDARTGATTVQIRSDGIAGVGVLAAMRSLGVQVGATGQIGVRVDRHGTPEALVLDQIVTDVDQLAHTRVQIDLADPSVAGLGDLVGSLIGLDNGARSVPVPDLSFAPADAAVQVATMRYHLVTNDTYGLEAAIGGVSVGRRSYVEAR